MLDITALHGVSLFSLDTVVWSCHIVISHLNVNIEVGAETPEVFGV